MRRHVSRVGRFGKDDNVSIPVATDEHESLFPLIKGEDAEELGIAEALDDLKILMSFPTETAIDLLILQFMYMQQIPEYPGRQNRRIPGQGK